MSAPLFVAGALLAAAAVVYQPPIDAPVADRFRPPASAFGPGNRGMEYDTTAGDTIRAAAPGEVVFAGRVGSTLHVSVLHPDSLRTTYSYLESIRVRRGDRVERGQMLGQAGDRFHLGAVVGDAYVDPALLFRRPTPRARLVADAEGRP